ncbi:MAG: ferritin [Gemmatimonadota bacterium]|nr:ferritin [Gemmatimonadota bacterium]
MIKETVQVALNQQLNSELYASYYYLSMSAYFHATNLTGFASWMRAQAQEELIHAMKIYDFINDREGEIALTTVAAPTRHWDDSLAAFEDAYRHEKAVTAQIYDLVDLSVEERDHATNTFLQWFVTEQVEEEATASDIVNKLKLVGNDGNGLFLLDRDLGTRNQVSDGNE